MMKWLVDLLGSRRVAQIEEPTFRKSARFSEKTGPHLVLLVPDSVGPYSFKLFTFSETRSAKVFIECAFPPSMNNELIAFWALHERPQTPPDEETNKVGETVVLIRDEVRIDIAQVFSFVDMESAHSFVRLEAQNGLSLQFVSVYWTLPVAIEADGEGFVRLTPEAADTFLREPEAEKSSEPKKVDAFIAEEAANGERDIPLDLVMIPYGGTADISSEEIEAPHWSNENELNEDSAENNTEQVAAEVSLPDISGEEIEAPHWSNGNELNENSAENNTERAAAEESPPDISSEEIEAPHWSNESELDEDSAKNNTEWATAEESPPDISSEEIEAPHWSNGNELNEDSAENNTERSELETLIRGPKRWEVREGPFQGFGSPPGKF